MVADAARWSRIEELFHAALSRPKEDRASFLAEATGNSEDLRREVERLLAEESEADRFLVGSVGAVAAAILSDLANPMTGRVLNNLIVGERLGAGGMGEVYRARDTKLGRDVAIKMLPPLLANDQGQLARFTREAHILASLSHPQIAAIYGLEEADGITALVLELVEGPTLYELMAQARLAMAKVLDIATQVASGLRAAHDARVIHRDLKPRNVMIRPDGVVKIVDFGLGKQTRPVALTSSQTTLSATRETDTTAGIIVGTVDYMSPQQARGERLDSRSDQFSFGSMLYEMVSGRRPFHRETVPQTLAAIMQDQPERLAILAPDVPESLEAIVHRCLAKDPADRFASTTELWRELVATRDDPRRTWSLSLPVPLAALEKQVAVLPFVNVGGDAENSHFCDGLVEVLTSKLSQLEQFQRTFRVVPASDVRQEAVTSARDAAKIFGVALVVTGSVQRVADRVRLTINVVDAVRLRQLRSKSIDVEARDLSVLQDTVVLETSGLLGVTLSLVEQQALSAGNTTVPGAYEFYLQGKGYLQRYESPANVENAIALFKRAIQLDNAYALAHAALGEALWRSYEITKNPQELEQARSSCDRAVQLNGRLSHVHVTLGIMSRTSGKYDDAIAEIENALRLEPMSAEAYRELASTYMEMGRPVEAEATFLRAVSMRPSFWGSYNDLGGFYFRNGRYPEAEANFRRVLELTPDNSRAYNNLGSVAYLQQRYDEATSMFQQAATLSPKKVLAFSNLGTVYFTVGRYAESARAFERAVAVSDRHYLVWRNLGAAYHWAPGERDKATAAFQRAAELAEAERQINPKNTRVLMLLADCYSMLGDSTRARETLQASLSLAPADPSVIFSAGVVCEQIGDRDEALTLIGKALHGGYPRALVEKSPSLASLRSDPRFVVPGSPQSSTAFTLEEEK